MKQHLDTAPVWAVYREDHECPLCALERESERSYIDNFLGGSVMEPAVRMEVNEKGFCSPHFRLLFDAGNRLGLALMAHTHLKETIKRLEQARPAPRASLFSRAQEPGDGQPSLTDSCIVCDRLETSMSRYEETLLYMWAHEPSFREAFDASKGLCVRHHLRLQSQAAKSLSARDSKAFLERLKCVTLDNLRRVEQELEWFTLKFDYRNQDKPWGNSRDAVERALNKLRSNTVRPESEDRS